jgi:hypothetical protein
MVQRRLVVGVLELIRPRFEVRPADGCPPAGTLNSAEPMPK